MPANDILKHPDIEDIREQFANLVHRGEPNECWPWLGSVDTNNYGLCYLGGTRDRAHRVAYVLANGPIGRWSDRRSLSICHECDNPICCNPAHLFEGTDADNVADMVAKGRIQQGEKHYAAKLTEAQVTAIRADRRADRLVALDYGVSRGTIASVRVPGSWPSLGPIEAIPNRHAEAVARGEDSSAAKLTAEQVLAIRADPRPYKVLAAAYGITPGGILAVKQRETWKHLPAQITDVPSQRACVLTDEQIVAIRASRESLQTLADRYAVSMATIGKVCRGLVGAHIPLLPDRFIRKRGPRPDTVRKQPATPRAAATTGKLALLRRAVEALIASREEMDEGWFIPTEAMLAIERAVQKGATE